MNNKEIKEKRLKGYFIEAAKEILKGEGLECANVRNIAERAGYSYATLYNYFKDLKELIFECTKDFCDECKDFVTAQVQELPDGMEKIKKIIMAYINFFVQYYSIFELFFLERISGMGIKRDSIKVILKLLDDLCSKQWEYSIKNNLIDKQSALKNMELLRYTVTGLLLFYINRRHPDTYNDFINLCEKNINALIES